MQDVKYCARCGKKISDVNTADWFSHISIKYCEDCAITVKRERTAARLKEYRKREKARKKEQLEYIKLLEAENRNLRRLFLPTEERKIEEHEQSEQAKSAGMQPASDML